jgi:hypothetical protein
MAPFPPDLSSLGLSATAGRVLHHLIATGQRSISQLAVETGIAGSVVSRAVRDLTLMELVQHNGGRPATVALAPGVGDAVRAMAGQRRQTATQRADALDGLAELLDRVAPEPWQDGRVHWLVPLRADAHQQEDAQVRMAVQSFAACVPRGHRPRGAPRRVPPYLALPWRVLIEDDWPQNAVVPGRTRLEVRRTQQRLPWLEIIDDRAAAIALGAQGCGRIAWSRDLHQVALALAGFESWWADADPVLTIEAGGRARAAQSTSPAQPLDRATAARQRR